MEIKPMQVVGEDENGNRLFYNNRSYKWIAEPDADCGFKDERRASVALPKLQRRYSARISNIRLTYTDKDNG